MPTFRLACGSILTPVVFSDGVVHWEALSDGVVRWEERPAQNALDTIKCTRNPGRWKRIRKRGYRPRVAIRRGRLIIVPRERSDCRVRMCRRVDIFRHLMTTVLTISLPTTNGLHPPPLHRTLLNQLLQPGLFA
jgi:hypothetical protein